MLLFVLILGAVAAFGRCLVLLPEALSSSQVASILEHVQTFGIQTPEASFARLLIISRHFYEALV